VVNQFYEAEIMTEYVIRGNTALLKCSIPSFVADFVQVESWVDDEGKIYVASEDYGKLSRYVPCKIWTNADFFSDFFREVFHCD
jgi:hypothetical protein